MKKLKFLLIILPLSLIALTGLTGCGNQAFSTEQALAESLADINGHVTITKQFHSDAITIIDNEEPYRLWIVEVTFTNKGYDDPVINIPNYWSIFTGDETNSKPEQVRTDLSALVTVPVSQTGKTVIFFGVDDDVEISDALLKFTCDNKVSYGRLTGGEIIEAYDWETKSVTEPLKIQMP